MAFISLKRTQKEQKSDLIKFPSTSEPYAYGLRINLEKEELDKLGLDLSSFNIGKKCVFTAKAEVSSMNESVDKKKRDFNISLQITDMDFAGLKKAPENKVAKYHKEKFAPPTGKTVEGY